MPSLIDTPVPYPVSPASSWLTSMTFLVMNGVYLDAPEEDTYEAGMSVTRHETTVTDLAKFIERYSRPLVE
ncbi:hypothetical protein [Fodinicurvata sediminis]|uniref:hypothetical protein n=1 Tax=Fodinicurvata sediminis TaxID=1121832 RepID=UPI0003B60E57|nr:hypothetical protein [Fodinicurvata sediminis]